MKKFNNISVIIISWSILFIIVVFSLLFCLLRIKSAVNDFVVSNAKSDLQYIANESIAEILEKENISYSDITVIDYAEDNSIKGIKIEPSKTNILKSKISNRIYKSIPKEEIYKVHIPLGTIIANDYLGGLGPKITFNSQISSGCVVDFESDFESVGINQTRHRIYLSIKLSGVILILGKHYNYQIKNKVIVAETVIVGNIPQSYADINDIGSSSDKIYKYLK